MGKFMGVEQERSIWQKERLQYWPATCKPEQMRESLVLNRRGGGLQADGSWFHQPTEVVVAGERGSEGAGWEARGRPAKCRREQCSVAQEDQMGGEKDLFIDIIAITFIEAKSYHK